jgi:Peptidase family M23
MTEYNYPGYGRTRENWLTSRPNTVGGFHGGNDNPAAPGTPVYAQYGGQVFRSGNIKGYGMAVVVKSIAADGRPFYQLYGHLGPDPLPAPGTPVAADKPIPGAVIGTKEYVQRMGGITSGPHLHREIISGGAPLQKDPKRGFGIFSSDITYKADPDAFDINHPVFPYQNNEPKPPPEVKKQQAAPLPTPPSPPNGPTPLLPPRSTAAPTAIPYLAQTQALDPAFGATAWLQRPTSPNVLAPEATAPFAPAAAAPRVAAAPMSMGPEKPNRRSTIRCLRRAPRPGASPIGSAIGIALVVCPGL